jgi:acetyl-CoA C-acetyltransferase
VRPLASQPSCFQCRLTSVVSRETVTISVDEEPFKLKADKVASLKPAFGPTGTVTAANASKLNDGASALVLVSAGRARASGLKPLARIVGPSLSLSLCRSDAHEQPGFADAERKPDEFPIAPADAIPKAVASAGLTMADIDLYEINEAFASVILANQSLLSTPGSCESQDDTES